MSQDSSDRDWTLVERPDRKRRRQSSSRDQLHEKDVSSPSSQSSVSERPVKQCSHADVAAAGPDEVSPPIPTYDQVLANDFADSDEIDEENHGFNDHNEYEHNDAERRVDHEDADMLLALQLSLADSDTEDFDVANFDDYARRPAPCTNIDDQIIRRLRRPPSRSRSTTPPIGLSPTLEPQAEQVLAHFSNNTAALQPPDALLTQALPNDLLPSAVLLDSTSGSIAPATASPQPAPAHPLPQSHSTDEEENDYLDDVIRTLFPDHSGPQEVQPTADDTSVIHPTPQRDRYDIAGISTYRIEPRGPNSLYTRYRASSSQIPQVASLPHHYSSRHLPGARPLDRPSPVPFSPASTAISATASTSKTRFNLSDPAQILAALKKRHPVLNPASGAPLINVLDLDTLHCILDCLYFPDCFALALACKALYTSLDLRARKSQYHIALLAKTGLYGGADAASHPQRRGLCRVCLYELPASYFRVASGSSICREDERGVCTDCVEFREKVEAAGMLEGEDRMAAVKNVWLVWRPSQRVVVEETGGFLWYRRRS